MPLNSTGFKIVYGLTTVLWVLYEWTRKRDYEEELTMEFSENHGSD